MLSSLRQQGKTIIVFGLKMRKREEGRRSWKDNESQGRKAMLPGRTFSFGSAWRVGISLLEIERLEEKEKRDGGKERERCISH